MAAGAEEYGDVQSAVVDAYGLLQDPKIQVMHARLDPGDGLFGLTDFILIVGRLLDGVR
jgi:hypothetical protein